MRSLILSATLTALATLVTAPANAEVGSTPRYHYETCTCTFGYGKACDTRVSCSTEVGYCFGSCQPGDQKLSTGARD